MKLKLLKKSVCGGGGGGGMDIMHSLIMVKLCGRRTFYIQLQVSYLLQSLAKLIISSSTF